MNEPDALRQRVWSDLRRVARPDSRFHWDFSAFIPDFEGSEACAAAVQALAVYRQAQVVCATPDNGLAEFRQRCLADGKTLIVPTYALGRGFWQLAPQAVPPDQQAFAATLDGLERFGQPYELEAVPLSVCPTLLVTGASVINTEGVRISADPSYFDLEWLILRSLELVTAQTPIVTIVHDCQVVEWPCAPRPISTITDFIVTPSRVLEVGPRYPKPDRLAWDELAWDVIREVPLLKALYERDHAGPARSRSQAPLR